MVRFGLFGCGRIGAMHAANLARHPDVELAAVYDVHAPAAAAVAAATGAEAVADVDAILGDAAVDAVLIASSTDTHADLLEASAKAGKAVLCEKPIDLDIDRVEEARAAIAGTSVPIMVGFNRRFDPGHRAARDAVRAGEIGALHQVIITSRDPALPPRAYLERAGGLMRDMTIHDFDLARFMLDEEPTHVFAIADALGDPVLGRELDEVDTAMIVLRTASGKMCHINNSRVAVYGYDQRVELMGNDGMLISGNRRPHELRRFSANRSESAEPLLHFFVERYQEAFTAEIDHFVRCVATGATPDASFEDGRRALLLANAAYRSLAEGRMVEVEG